MNDHITRATDTDPSPVISETGLIANGPLVTAIALPEGHGLLPLVLSFEQTGTWLGLGKTKLQQLVNRHELETAKVDGRTLILTRSAIALIERNLVARDR